MKQNEVQRAERAVKQPPMTREERRDLDCQITGLKNSLKFVHALRDLQKNDRDYRCWSCRKIPTRLESKCQTKKHRFCLHCFNKPPPEGQVSKLRRRCGDCLVAGPEVDEGLKEYRRFLKRWRKGQKYQCIECPEVLVSKMKIRSNLRSNNYAYVHAKRKHNCKIEMDRFNLETLFEPFEIQLPGGYASIAED